MLTVDVAKGTASGERFELGKSRLNEKFQQTTFTTVQEWFELRKKDCFQLSTSDLVAYLYFIFLNTTSLSSSIRVCFSIILLLEMNEEFNFLFPVTQEIEDRLC